MSGPIPILEKLVSFETVSSNSNLEMIDYVEAFLKERDFQVSRFPDSTGMKAGLYAQKGEGEEGILLSGHTDVVPVEGQDWTRNPFVLTPEGDRLYGRGTTDMKGFIACMLDLADKVADLELNEPLKIVLSYDEEIGCFGIQEMLEDLAPMLGQPRACIVGEPTEMKIALGHKGKSSLSAVCVGQSGHSGLAPQFVNALHIATDFVLRLRNIQAQYTATGGRDNAYRVPYSTIHVGTINSGCAVNMVPDKAELLFEYRHLPINKPAELIAKIKDAAQKLEDIYQLRWAGAKILIHQKSSYPGFEVEPLDGVVEFAMKLAGSTATTKVSFGTEAGFFQELGIPTVVCGPGNMEKQGHQPDEYITLGEIYKCEAMMNRVLDELTNFSEV